MPELGGGGHNRNGWETYKRELRRIADDWPDWTKWRGSVERDLKFLMWFALGVISVIGGWFVWFMQRALR